MRMSEQIDKLAEALSKAQGEIKNAAKDSQNPFFKSNYADLASVFAAFRPQFAQNGLAIVQVPELLDGKANVHTLLLHSSGQWISGELSMSPVKQDPQGIGSCITYIRRYAAQAFAGIAADDDDGNAASGKSDRPQQMPRQQSTTVGGPAPAPPPKPRPTPQATVAVKPKPKYDERDYMPKDVITDDDIPF